MGTVPPDGPRPESESGKGVRQEPGAGGARREKHTTTSRAMRAAWWWIDRWRQSTAYTDMTAEEQGLYRNLLDEVWLREDCIIPDDERIISRVSGDPEAWKRCGAKVLRWMKKVPGGWTHATALEVIGQSLRRAEKQKRYRERIGNADGNGSDNKSGSPSPSPSPSYVQRRTVPASVQEGGAGGRIEKRRRLVEEHPRETGESLEAHRGRIDALLEQGERP